MRPVKARSRRPFTQFFGPFQSRQRIRDAIENAGLHFRPGLSFGGLDALPASRDGSTGPLHCVAEHMGVPPKHLVANPCSHFVEIECTGLSSHLCMKNDLEQQISQFVAQSGHIIPGNRIRDLIRFLNRIRSDAGEVLLAVPGAACFRIPQACHDFT